MRKLRFAPLAAALVLAAPAGGAPQTRDYDPVFSPDGTTIAFVRSNGLRTSIQLVGSDGRHLRTLVTAPAGAQYLNWSPDGSSLAYSGGGIWRVDLADPAPRLLTAASPDPWQPSWSPDGASIAYSQFERCFRCTGIWVMGADGSQPHELLQDGRRPTWSPDGTKLAVSLAHALVIGLDGGTLVPGGGAYTVWSPHGAYVAYTSDGLWLANVETQTKRRLTRYENEKPAWSPEGKLIAGGYRGRVALVRVKDGKLVHVFPASTVESGAPTWSRTGLVAFVHAGSCGIDVAREDGTGVRRLTRTC